MNELDELEKPTEEIEPNKRIVRNLVLVVVAMFAFGFLLVPIYQVFCEVTGLNGKTSTKAYKAVDKAIDKTRLVEVQFVASNNDGMHWKFKSNIGKIVVHPGEPTDATFYAANTSAKKMVAQAIPSIAPGEAAQYFHKTECFCFEQQALEAHEEINMPVRFIVDPDLPKDIKQITLSYTLFDVSNKFGNDKEEKVKELLEKTHAKFDKVKAL